MGDVASRFKAAELLTSKEINEVAKAFEKIYKEPLKFPNLLQVDSGKEFMGSVNKLMDDKGVTIGNVNIHRDQGILNRTLGEKLFIFINSRSKFSTRESFNIWVKRLPEVVKSF